MGRSVTDPNVNHENTGRSGRFNDFVAADERVESVMFPLADGMTVAYRR